MSKSNTGPTPADGNTSVPKFFTNPMSVFRSRNLTGLCPISIDMIEPKLYLGSRSAASDIKTLKKYGITHILTIEDMPLSDKITSSKKVKYIELSDQPQEDLLSHLEETDEFISDAVAQGAVLVHCFYGVSRSASLVIAHIMKHHHLNYDQAYARVHQKRSRVYPNSGFVSQLNLYKEMGFKIDPNNIKYRSFRLTVAANKFRIFKTLPVDFQDVIKPDPGVDPGVPETGSYCCKKCRRILALESNRIPHKYKAEVCAKNYFFEPLAWMNVVSQSQSKLLCPKCNAEVGSFSWIAGHRCSCDVKVAPAFCLVPTDVDVTKSKT